MFQGCCSISEKETLHLIEGGTEVTQYGDVPFYHEFPCL